MLLPYRAVTSFLQRKKIMALFGQLCVNALSGCYLISTKVSCFTSMRKVLKCQCPLGLLPHFYEPDFVAPCEMIASVSMPYRAVTSFLLQRHYTAFRLVMCVNALSGCYLISTVQIRAMNLPRKRCVNALSGCYLISTQVIYSKSPH